MSSVPPPPPPGQYPPPHEQWQQPAPPQGDRYYPLPGQQGQDYYGQQPLQEPPKKGSRWREWAILLAGLSVVAGLATVFDGDESASVEPQSTVAQVVCDSFTEFIEENPDARVIQAIGFAADWRRALIEEGYDPSIVGRSVASTCRNGYNNEVLMGYGGFGPLADAVDFTLDRGACRERGDLGGVMSMSSTGGDGGRYTIELEMDYVANGVVEHQSTEYVDVTRGGNGSAFEFFLPSDLPAGGECKVAIAAVKPE